MVREITVTSLSGRGSVTMKSRDYQGYWLDTVDWGQASGQHQEYQHLNQVGSTIVGTTMEKRPLSITGWVVDGGKGTLRSRCDFLNHFISPVEDYALEYEGKKIQFRPDHSIQYSAEYLKNNELVRQFLIQASCPFPLFSALADTAAAFNATGRLFRFPTDFGQEKPLVFGTQSNTYMVEVSNAGGFQTGIVVKMNFSGPVQNPRVRNLTTGQMDGVNRTFSRGEGLEISTLPGKKRMTLYTPEGERENIIKYRDLRTDWIHLAPGRNLLALDCDDLNQRAAMAVTVYFTPLYLEVQ